MTRRILLTLPVMLLATTLLVACLDEPADNGDAGQNNNTADDGGADAEPSPDAAVNCQPDDLVAQLTCGSGRKCTLIDDDHVGCAPAGFTPAYASCTDERPDECALATLCSDADDAGRFICLPFCMELGGACLNGKCIHSIPLAGGGAAYLCSPADGCDPVDNSGCEVGEYCYLDRTGGGLTFCVDTPGTGIAGAVCTNDYACLPGYNCFGPVGNGNCYELCHSGVNADCGTGTCTDIPNTDYGICFN